MNFGVDVGIAVAAVESWAMFTLYQVVKRSITETVPERTSVHTRNDTFGTISAAKQDYLIHFSKMYMIPVTQWLTFTCSHCTGSVSAILRFTIWYSHIALH